MDSNTQRVRSYKMEYTYEILEIGSSKILLRSDGASIPFETANSDYQEYLAANEAKTK
jgi:hypothetical protein